MPCGSRRWRAKAASVKSTLVDPNARSAGRGSIVTCVLKSARRISLSVSITLAYALPCQRVDHEEPILARRHAAFRAEAQQDMTRHESCSCRIGERIPIVPFMMERRPSPRVGSATALASLAERSPRGRGSRPTLSRVIGCHTNFAEPGHRANAAPAGRRGGIGGSIRGAGEPTGRRQGSLIATRNSALYAYREEPIFRRCARAVLRGSLGETGHDHRHVGAVRRPNSGG